MFHRYLRHIKSKQDHHRRNYALGFSTVITTAIFLVWLSVIVPRNASTVVAESEVNKRLDSETPMVTLQRGVSQSFEGINGLLRGAGEKSVNLQTEYDKMKTQVQTGQIQVVPDNNLEQGY